MPHTGEGHAPSCPPFRDGRGRPCSLRPPRPRRIGRLCRSRLHREGEHLTNLIGDLDALLWDQGRLTEADRNFLQEFRPRILPASDGRVLLSSADYSTFLDIRSRYLAERRSHRELAVRIGVLAPRKKDRTP